MLEEKTSFCANASGMGALAADEVDRQFREVARYSYRMAAAMLAEMPAVPALGEKI